MSTHDVSFSGSGIPQTVLPEEAAGVADAVAQACALEGEERRAALVVAVSNAPRALLGWAELGDNARDTIESYAYYRIGYHRGLDALRQNGWRGSGYVKWEHPSNQPFLRCLDGLQRRAAEIGETDEAERCALFLKQLDPTWPPAS